MKIKKPRQRVAKRLIAEAASMAKGAEKAREPKGAGRSGKPAPAAGDLGEKEKRRSQGGPGRARRTGEPAPAARDPGGGRNSGASVSGSFVVVLIGLLSSLCSSYHSL